MRILLVFLVLVCVRGACSFRQAWFEGDDIVIAAGVAALINDNCGDDYRYSVQPGYYRLVEGIVRGMGGDIGLVPEVMFALSAIAGAWLVALGLLAFPKQLGTRERWVLSAVLLANPILWVSSQYGNTGLLSCALGTSAVVWLSRSPGRISEACALLLWGCATLVRNDAVLLVGAIAWLLWRRHGLKGMVEDRAVRVESVDMEPVRGPASLRTGGRRPARSPSVPAVSRAIRSAGGLHGRGHLARHLRLAPTHDPAAEGVGGSSREFTAGLGDPARTGPRQAR